MAARRKKPNKKPTRGKVVVTEAPRLLVRWRADGWEFFGTFVLVTDDDEVDLLASETEDATYVTNSGTKHGPQEEARPQKGVVVRRRDHVIESGHVRRR